MHRRIKRMVFSWPMFWIAVVGVVAVSVVATLYEHSTLTDLGQGVQVHCLNSVNVMDDHSVFVVSDQEVWVVNTGTKPARLEITYPKKNAKTKALWSETLEPGEKRYYKADYALFTGMFLKVPAE